jgi:hypothetical protein
MHPDIRVFAQCIASGGITMGGNYYPDIRQNENLMHDYLISG